ncbi:MAG: amino acid ABC transporter substrate-binding protein, partial [Pseudomonadota bacterium]
MMRPFVSLFLAAALAAPVAAQTIDRIKSEGEIRLGFREDAAPLSFLDDAGLPAGYAVEVCG